MAYIFHHDTKYSVGEWPYSLNCKQFLGYSDHLIIDDWCEANIGRMTVNWIRRGGSQWKFKTETHMIMFMLKWNGHEGPITIEDIAEG